MLMGAAAEVAWQVEDEDSAHLFPNKQFKGLKTMT